MGFHEFSSPYDWSRIASYKRTAKAAFGGMIDLCIAIATRLNWVAVAPAQRSVLRPGPRFRTRVIAQMRGWLAESGWGNAQRIS